MYKKLLSVLLFIIVILQVDVSFGQSSYKERLVALVEDNRIPVWMSEQIKSDLEPFKANRIPLESICETSPKWQTSGVVRYTIKEGKLTIHPSPLCSTLSVLESRCKQYNAIVKALTDTIRVPDVEFTVYLGDGFIGGNSHTLPGPIFGFSKDKNLDTNALLVPDFHALEIYPPLIEDVEIGNRAYPWHVKVNKAFWRGASTCNYLDITLSNYTACPRLKLVEIARINSDLIDAGLTMCVQMDEETRKLFSNYLVSSVSVSEHLKYKYLILTDGNGAAYPRGFWHLFGNSVVFKQKSDSVQWFYRGLKPFVHFIPFNEDFSDLIEKIQWATNHDAETRFIAAQGRAFALNNLCLENNLFYLYILLKEFSALQQASNYKQEL